MLRITLGCQVSKLFDKFKIPQFYLFFSDVFEIPFDPDWEVDRNLFVTTETLGEGAFGVVVKANASGLVRGEEEHPTVAIKMLKGL